MQLSALCDLDFTVKSEHWCTVIAQEQRIRAQLETLNKNASPHHQNFADLGHQISGTEMVWRTWTEKQRDQLHLQLAQVLAQKAEEAQKMRLAFGRREVAKSLCLRKKLH